MSGPGGGGEGVCRKTRRWGQQARRRAGALGGTSLCCASSVSRSAQLQKLRSSSGPGSVLHGRGSLVQQAVAAMSAAYSHPPCGPEHVGSAKHSRERHECPPSHSSSFCWQYARARCRGRSGCLKTSCTARSNLLTQSSQATERALLIGKHDASGDGM